MYSSIGFSFSFTLTKQFRDLFSKKSIRYSWQKNGGVGGMLGESRLCMSMTLQNCAKWSFVLPSRQRQRCVELICWLVTVDILALCTTPLQVDLRSVKPFPHFVSFKPPLIPQRVVWWKHGESRLHFCKKSSFRCNNQPLLYFTGNKNNQSRLKKIYSTPQ